MWMFMLMLKKNSIKIPLGIKPAIRAKTESVLKAFQLAVYRRLPDWLTLLSEIFADISCRNMNPGNGLQIRQNGFSLFRFVFWFYGHVFSPCNFGPALLSSAFSFFSLRLFSSPDSEYSGICKNQCRTD